jgi:hypothetical protein
MDSRVEPNEKCIITQFKNVTVGGKTYKVAADARQPGADARDDAGTRMINSVIKQARQVKERDERLD